MFKKFKSILQTNPKKKIFLFVDKYGNITESYNYSEFNKVTNTVANSLKHLVKNSKNFCNNNVILVYPPGLDFAVAFFGSIKSGLIPVPVVPPTNSREQVNLLIHFANDCKSNIVLTNSVYYKMMYPIIKLLETSEPNNPINRLKWIITDNFEQNNENIYELDKIAFIQYTSGSTSKPKGIYISHDHLVFQSEQCIKHLYIDVKISLIFVV